MIIIIKKIVWMFKLVKIMLQFGLYVIKEISVIILMFYGKIILYIK